MTRHAVMLTSDQVALLTELALRAADDAFAGEPRLAALADVTARLTAASAAGAVSKRPLPGDILREQIQAHARAVSNHADNIDALRTRAARINDAARNPEQALLYARRSPGRPPAIINIVRVTARDIVFTFDGRDTEHRASRKHRETRDGWRIEHLDPKYQ